MAVQKLGRGVNLGGWLSQGPDDEDHRKSFITRDDYARIADWGFENVRIPFDYPLICPDDKGDALSEAGLAWIDRALEWAEEAGLVAVLDMHKLPGFSFMDPVNNPGAVPPLFTEGACRNLFFSLWRSLAERYRGRVSTMVLELANEIAAPEPGQWNDLAAGAVRAIREVEPSRPIVIGSNCWNVCATYPDLAAVDDPAVIYNFHFYNPFPFTHQKASWSPEMVYYGTTVPYPGKAAGLRDASERARAEGKAWIARQLADQATWFEDRHADEGFLEELMAPSFAFAKEHGVPLYCGEFGVIAEAPIEDARRWYVDALKVFRRHDVDWSVWSYKGMAFGLVDKEGKVNDAEILEILRKG